MGGGVCDERGGGMKENEWEVGGRRRSNDVRGVLLVWGSVGNDEVRVVGREIRVR